MIAVILSPVGILYSWIECPKSFQNLRNEIFPKNHLFEHLEFEFLGTSGVSKIENENADGSNAIGVNDRFQEHGKSAWWNLDNISGILQQFG